MVKSHRPEKGESAFAVESESARLNNRAAVKLLLCRTGERH